MIKNKNKDRLKKISEYYERKNKIINRIKFGVITSIGIVFSFIIYKFIY